MTTVSTAATVEVTCEDLRREPPYAIVGDCGNLSLVVGEISESSVVPGMVRVEVEHGTLYLDPDLPVKVQMTAPEPAPVNDDFEAMRGVLEDPGTPPMVVGFTDDGERVVAFLDGMHPAEVIPALGFMRSVGLKVTGRAHDLVAGGDPVAVMTTILCDATSWETKFTPLVGGGERVVTERPTCGLTYGAIASVLTVPEMAGR